MVLQGLPLSIATELPAGKLWLRAKKDRIGKDNDSPNLKTIYKEKP